MTEENKTEEVAEKPADKPVDQYEQKALDMGWRPREEFHGEDEDFIDAKEFVRRKPLFDKIESLNGAVRNTQSTVSALMEHNRKIEQAAYDRAVKALRADQKAAASEGDIVKVQEIQEEIDEHKERAAQAPTQTAPAALPVEVTNWIAKNSWYTRDGRMKATADAIGLEGNQQGLRGQPLLDYIEKEVRKEYPQKFTNPNRDRASSVEGNGSGKSSGARSSGDDYALNDQEKRIMENLVRSKTMTKSEYIKQLKQAKGEE